MSWKKNIPLSLRIKLANLRRLKNPANILGRYFAGAHQCYVAESAHSNEWTKVALGRNAQIQRGTSFHINNVNEDKQIVVGERAFIGQNCFFSSGNLIDIGRDSLVGASCNFLGAGHEYHDPTMPYAKAKVVSYGRIILEPNTWIGTGSSIIGNVRIGFGTVVAANSGIRKSLPPLCLVAGNPAKILKLFNWNTREWEPVNCQESELDALIQTHLQRLPTLEEFTSALDTNLN